MQIECPACAARYDVPDEVVRPGRAMRCARCGETWAPLAVDAAPVVEAAPVVDAAPQFSPEVAPDALDMRPAAGLAVEEWPEEDAAAGARTPLVPAPAAGHGAALIVAWLASAAMLVAACGVLWHFHARIEQAWRPSERLFRLFGR